jgi:hypothetical protein
LTWALGSFNAAAFTLALLLLLYPRGGFGDLLAGLSTVSGLSLYLALWATTVYATRRALRGLDLLAETPSQGDAFFGRALRWGGFTGVAFLAELALVQLAAALAGGNVEVLRALPFFVVFGFIASLVAFVVGALVGVTLGAVDLAGIRLSRRLVRD